jgi:hypothetical protein
MNIDFIERLRAAAAEHGAVANLLEALDASLLIDDNGNKEIVGDDENISLLKDALIAAQFSAYDREDDHG